MTEVGNRAERGGRSPKVVSRKTSTARRPAAAGTASANGDSAEATRRTEILETANTVIAASGLRTSLQQIADAAGILAGSLYHHFESKEAILIELIRRYHAELDQIGQAALARLDQPDSRPVDTQIVELGCAIARCAVAHRAALQMSFYEGPSSDPELMALTRYRPASVQEAMVQTLRAGRWSGYIREDLDLSILADRICQTMLHVGLDVIRNNADTDQVATVFCRIILQGLAAHRPSDTTLNRSAAFAAAEEVIATWDTEDESALSDKAAHVRAAARTEFGRRGYEGTTVRDIAAAAGLGTGTVYRLIGSKEELLMSIMLAFGARVGAGWKAVLGSASTPVEKLDALSWVNIQALDRFPDEFRIQLAWMRHSPPDTPNPGAAFTVRVRQMKALLTEGIRSGEIRVQYPAPADTLSRCVIGLQWIPENILAEIGTANALTHSRDTVLRGVSTVTD